MGWSTETIRIGSGEIYVNQRYYVKADKLKKFEAKLDEKVAEFIADEIKKEYAQELADGEITFMGSGVEVGYS
jgi:predicted house-cleaning noncanonical NTP pyrophosphatase (MazG superfamily)